MLLSKTYRNLVLLLFSFCSQIGVGQVYWGLHYQHGYNVPAYELSPKTIRTSPYVSLSYRINTQSSGSLLDTYYNGPQLSFQLLYQNLGNDKVMGYVLGVVPELKFRLWEGKKSTLYGGGGLGAGWTNRPFDKNTNPKNTALGTYWNFYAQASFEYQYHIDEDYVLGIEIGVHHLSNSFFSFPNLGVNIPSGGISIAKKIKGNKSYKVESESRNLVLKTKWRPLFRFIYGITERGFDGPKFAVVGGGFAMHKRIATHRTVLLGGEYMFDESSYYFVSRASGQDGEASKRHARRYMLFAGHEYHFGYLSLVTEAGIYLSNQFNRQSIISTKFGLNFFPFHQFFKEKHQFSMGVFIRAYFLRADFFEINVNYRL